VSYKKKNRKKEWKTVKISKELYEKLMKLKGAYLIDQKKSISLSDLIEALIYDRIPEVLPLAKSKDINLDEVLSLKERK